MHHAAELPEAVVEVLLAPQVRPHAGRGAPGELHGLDARHRGGQDAGDPGAVALLGGKKTQHHGHHIIIIIIYILLSIYILCTSIILL